MINRQELQKGGDRYLEPGCSRVVSTNPIYKDAQRVLTMLGEDGEVETPCEGKRRTRRVSIGPLEITHIDRHVSYEPQSSDPA